MSPSRCRGRRRSPSPSTRQQRRPKRAGLLPRRRLWRSRNQAPKGLRTPPPNNHPPHWSPDQSRVPPRTPPPRADEGGPLTGVAAESREDVEPGLPTTAGDPVLNQERPPGEPVQGQPQQEEARDTPSVQALLDPNAPPISMPPELLHEIFRAWDFQHPVVLTPGGTMKGDWDGTLTAEVPAEGAPDTEITFSPRVPGTPLVVRQRAAPPPDQLSAQERAALEGVGGDLPAIPLSLSDEEGGKLPAEWQSPSPAKKKARNVAPRQEAEPQPSTSGSKTTKKDSRSRTSWGHLRPAKEYQRLADAKARMATQGPGSSFHRTPPSAGRRGRRFAPNTPAGADRAHSPHPLGPTPHQVVWLPWWVVSGREPNNMERWAAFLLPPLDMGEQFSTSGGEVNARLVDHGDYSYSVIASVTTEYVLSRREAERSSRHAAGQGAARDTQDRTQDQVSTLAHL